jgi:hypothetical protein
MDGELGHGDEHRESEGLLLQVADLHLTLTRCSNLQRTPQSHTAWILRASTGRLGRWKTFSIEHPNHFSLCWKIDHYVTSHSAIIYNMLHTIYIHPRAPYTVCHHPKLAPGDLADERTFISSSAQNTSTCSDGYTYPDKFTPRHMPPTILLALAARFSHRAPSTCLLEVVDIHLH